MQITVIPTPFFEKKKCEYKVKTFVNMGVNFSGFNSIIDLGCGNGELTRIIYSKNMNCQIIGIDHSEIAIRIATLLSQQKSMTIKYEVGDIGEDATSLKYRDIDCIVSCCVLEHIYDHKINNIVIKMRNTLKTNGMLLLTFSHTKSIFHIQRSIIEYCGKWRYGYSRDFHVDEIVKLIENNGFRINNFCIMPCDGGRGSWSFLDKIMHFFSEKNGRYLFVVATKY